MLGGVIVEDDSESVPLDVRGQPYHRPHQTQVLDFGGGSPNPPQGASHTSPAAEVHG